MRIFENRDEEEVRNWKMERKWRVLISVEETGCWRGVVRRGKNDDVEREEYNGERVVMLKRNCNIEGD